MNTLRALRDVLFWSHRERLCKRRGYHQGTPLADPICCQDCGTTDPFSRVPLLGPNGLR